MGIKQLLNKYSRRKPTGDPEDGGEAQDGCADGACCDQCSDAVGVSGAAAAPQDLSDPLHGTPYRMVSVLREEGMGQSVLLAVDQRKVPVVVKLLERGPNVSLKVEPELVKHAQCKGHPNVIELLDVLTTSKHLAIVMEYADAGALRTAIEQHGRMREGLARGIMQQLLRALRQYHAVGMVKRDLRTNVYLAGDPQAPQVKLGDFAYSKTEQVNSDPKSALGTLVHTAPEEITAPNQSDDRAADVWGCGVLLYAMLTGQYPFGQLCEAYDLKAVQDMLQRIMSVSYELPPYLSPEAKDLLQHVLVGVGSRLTLEQFCAHPWTAEGLPPGFWDVDLAAAAAASPFPPVPEDRLRAVCQDAQRVLTSALSGDIDHNIDEVMDMEECEAAFDDLDLGLGAGLGEEYQGTVG